MKKTIVAFVFLLLLHICVGQTSNRQKAFSINGKIIGSAGQYVTLYYFDNTGRPIKDTAFIENNEFSFKGFISEPTFSYLESGASLNESGKKYGIEFFIESSDIRTEVNFDAVAHSKTIGSITQSEKEYLDSLKAPILRHLVQLDEKYSALISKYKQLKNFIYRDSADSVFEEKTLLRRCTAKMDCEFIASNPNSFVSSFLLVYYATKLSFDSSKMLYDKLSRKVQIGRTGIEVQKTLDRRESITEGKTAKDFSVYDKDGEIITLSSFKGKYVLLDFWASWCKPCREASPMLKQIFTKYNKKELIIISISEDSDIGKWKKAIDDDGLGNWIHVLASKDIDKYRQGLSDGQDIIDKYYVPSIPFQVLLNEKGQIVKTFEGFDKETCQQLDMLMAKTVRRN